MFIPNAPVSPLVSKSLSALRNTFPQEGRLFVDCITDLMEILRDFQQYEASERCGDVLTSLNKCFDNLNGKGKAADLAAIHLEIEKYQEMVKIAKIRIMMEPPSSRSAQ